MVRCLWLLFVLLASPVWAQPAEWSAPVTLVASDNPIGLDSAGDRLCYLNGNKVRISDDEGATWRPQVTLPDGPVYPYLERPIACDGNLVAVLAVRVLTASEPDWCCNRPGLGEYWLWLSQDGGWTFASPVRVAAPGSRGLRGSVAIANGVVHMTWMAMQGHLNEGTNSWNVEYRRWANGSLGPLVTLAAGTNPVGAGRPSIAASGNTVVAAWMDARDNKPACALEGNFLMPICTEIYTKRSIDAGVTFGPAVRQTNSGTAYVGRPTIAAFAGTFALHYDYRAVGGDNDLAQQVSSDGGASWMPGWLYQGPGDQTHNAAAFDATEAFSAWQGPYGRYSLDGMQTWQPEVSNLNAGGYVPAVAITSTRVHLVYGQSYRWRPRTTPGPPPPDPPPDPCVADPLLVPTGWGWPTDPTVTRVFITTNGRTCPVIEVAR